MWERFKKKFIGDKGFYRMLLVLAVPMIVQNGITNFVNMLDNIMVGQLGTEPMSGVAIANQLIMVFNLCVFGGISGAGIFTAQFHGSGNSEGVRHTFRFKLIVCSILCAVFITGFSFFGSSLIELYLHRSDSASDLALTLQEGVKYLRVMLVGLVPFAVTNAYVSTLRETGETMLPMKAGIAAVGVNFVFNYLLIFGHFGFPRLGAAGAAIATVLSRFVEVGIVVIWTHCHKDKNPFIRGAYRGFSVPWDLARRIIARGWPLLLNETLFSLGNTMLVQCYSTRGIDAIAAVNISSTLSNLFKIVMMAAGSAIAIIMGNLLGSGRMKEARDQNTKLIFASVMSCVLIGAVLFLVAPLFPNLYNTSPAVRSLATLFLRLSAAMLPVMAFNNCCYFTLRSGGKTFITFIFDSVFIWVIILPPTFLLAQLTSVSVVTLYALVQGLEIIKSGAGLYLLKRGDWLTNIVS